MKLTSETITSAAGWSAVLDELPCAHPLQSWAWGKFKSRWGWTSRPLRFALDGQTVAAALILKRAIPRTPFSILYAPRGPIFDFEQEPLRRAVLGELAAAGRRERAVLVKIDPAVAAATGEEGIPSPTGQAFLETLRALGWRYSTEQIQFRNTVTLDLTRDEEALLADMKQKTRYNIRLAGRKGVVIRAGDEADFPTILDLYRETAERDRFLIRPAAYYLDGWQSLFRAGLAQPFLAEFEGQPLSAVIVLRQGPLAIYMYGASTDRERQRMPNHLLQWEAIRWARAQGCRVYDFWGAPDRFDETDSLWGVWQFKRGFNGEVVHHVGAWDFPVRPSLYWLFTRVLPRYRSLLRRSAGGPGE